MRDDLRERMNRFKKAFAYLQGEQIVEKQADLAVILKASEGTVSRALKGDKNALTENLMRRFVVEFPIFSIDWLLYGEGEMINNQHNPSEANKEDGLIESMLEQIKSLTAQNASLVSTINELSKAMSALVEENQRLKAPTAYRSMSVVPSMVADQAADYPAKKCSNSNN